MKRRVLFIGNCQFIVLAKLYERFGGRTSSETVNVLPSYELLTDESREAVAGADLIVEQRVDMAPQADVGGVVTRAERHFVPLLAGGFLWPFAGQPHPCNETPWFLTAGPWNAELADGYLNRLLLQSVPPDEAIQQYLNLDVAKVRDLDRTLELILDRQRARDAACGYDIASVVEDRFRQELMFLTPHHPGLRVTLTAAAQFFEHMGVARQAADRMAEQTLVSPFPTDGLPIHPSVARHFGLAYGHEGERYRHLYEGSFTFAEYVARYVRNEWNRDLAEGLANAGASPELALSQLEIALQTSPGSAEAHFVKGDLLRRLGRSAEAEAPTRRAIELAPEKPSYHSGLAHLLAGAGRQEEAFEEMSEATRLDPFDPHFLGMRALLALRTNRPADAEADARLLLELEPANAFGCQMLGEALLRLDDPLAAAEQFREAARIEPENQGHLASLGEALAAAGRASGLPEPSRLRWSAAKKTGMEARRADPAGDPRQFAMLDVVLATLRGDAAQARQAMREVFALAEPTLSQDDWMFENLLGTACACELFEFATNILNVRFRERWCSGVGVLAEAPDALAVRWTVQDGGTCRFDMFPALYDVDDTIESTLHWSRWMSLFHHYVRSAAPVRGHTDINLFDVGLTPGISCCDDKPGYFLVPDPVFIASRGYADLRGEFEAADVPWADRIPQAFWRGSTTGNHQDELERLPRLRLCRLARSPESRGLLDAAITSVVQLTADWAEKVMQSGLMGSPVPQTDYLRYKYQVDIDGNSNAWAGLYERLLTAAPSSRSPLRPTTGSGTTTVWFPGGISSPCSQTCRTSSTRFAGCSATTNWRGRSANAARRWRCPWSSRASRCRPRPRCRPRCAPPPGCRWWRRVSARNRRRESVC